MKKEITIKELREIQLQMMDKIHEFCESRNIRYSLGGGTLLGAVRHKGYIPWDDDMDIMLPRPDYDRFIKEYDGFNKNYTVQTYCNDDSYFFPFAKVYDNRTVLIEEGARNGIYIDVFPIDGLPEECMGKYFDIYRGLIKKLIRVTAFYKFKTDRNFLIMKIKYSIKKKIFPNRESILSSLETLFHSYPFESSKYAGAIVGRYGLKECMETETFKKYVLLDFENRKFPCIANYDAYLKKHYGDYMVLPPKSQQVSLHNFEAYWK